CTLENRGQLLRITAHTGGSVLLPCSCTDLQTQPEELIWQKENRNTQTYDEISSESGNSVSVISFSLIPVLLLLMVLGGVIYWRYRGRRQGQAESREQQQTEREQDSQDDVTYSTIVLSRTPAAPTVIGIEDKAEYAVLKAALWRTEDNYCPSQLIQEGNVMYWFILIPVVLLLLGIGGVIYWICRGCTLENSAQLQTITAHTGGSVLLPCSCTDLQTTPEEFSWKKYKGNEWVDTTFNSDQYRNKVQMFNHRSPGNLSLLISHLTEEDGGEHKCGVKGSYIIIRLTLEEPLPFVPFALVTVIFLHIIVAVVYHTKRTKDPARVHYSTVDGDGA
ncbi:hypothetical protein NFI96_009810, partial [Prochilodus magdalenae]